MASRDKILQMQKTCANKDIDAYNKFTPLVVRHSKFPEQFKKDHSRLQFLHDHQFEPYLSDMLKLGYSEGMILDYNQIPKAPDLRSNKSFPELMQLPSINRINYPNLDDQFSAPIDFRMRNCSALGSSLSFGSSSRHHSHPK